jgi:uncharacterized protein
MMHGLTGAVDKVSGALGAWLVESRGRACDLDHGPLDSLSVDDLQRLRGRGYLTELTQAEEQDLLVEVAAQLHQLDLTRTRASFMIVPSYMCNLRCPYCFQPHLMHAGRGPFGALLTHEQIEQIFAAIDRYQPGGAVAAALGLGDAAPPTSQAAPLSIGLFGGEPLTARTIPVVSEILEHAAARRFSLWAITNGVELKEFEELLGPGRIEDLQITLDGLAELHDTRRIGPGFRHTFDTIVDNIGLALNCGARVAVRINVDRTNISSLPELDALFAQLGWNDNADFFADAAVVSPEGVHKDLVTRAELVTFTTTMKEVRGAKIGSYERLAQEVLVQCLSSDGYPFQSVINCSAEAGQLIFDPLGDVYTCWDELGDSKRRIGTYGPGGLAFDHDTALQWLTRFPGAIEQCSQCQYALIHKSGCANHARAMSGTMFASACESFKEFFPSTLAHAYAQIERGLLRESDQPAPAACQIPVRPMFG